MIASTPHNSLSLCLATLDEVRRCSCGKCWTSERAAVVGSSVHTVVVAWASELVVVPRVGEYMATVGERATTAEAWMGECTTMSTSNEHVVAMAWADERV